MQSQRWMFTSPGAENEYKRPSVTQEQYAAVIEAKQAQEKCPLTESEQKRRELESFMWQQMTEKVLDQIKEQQRYMNEMHVTRSSYKEFYDKPGFKVRELGTEINKELQLKYPLYTDTAKSIHLRKIDKIKAKESIHRPHSIIFRRDNRFTGRLSNPLDIHNPVGPGHFAYV